MEKQNEHSEIEELKSRFAQKHVQVNDLQTKINSLYNSHSWKLSKPLHFACRFALKVVRRVLPRKVKTALRVLRNDGIKGVILVIRSLQANKKELKRIQKQQNIDAKLVKNELKNAFFIKRPEITNNIVEIKKAIDASDVVSFDIFDTLLCRLVSKPTDVFRIMEEQLGITGFTEMRKKMQFDASVEAEKTKHIPHENLDGIYDWISHHSNLQCDWNAVKALELKIEADLLVANPEIKEVYDYAVEHKKRIIAVSDMYIDGNFLSKKLKEVGYNNIAKVYVSSDCHMAKFRGDMLPFVVKTEQVSASQLVHIGDNIKDDYESVLAEGIKAVHYKTDSNNYYDSVSDSMHNGIVSVLTKKNSNFWFVLAASVGGRIYSYLFNWFVKKIKYTKNKRIYFLSRDGYNLYEICRQHGIQNIDYLYSSRRSLLLAGIDTLSDEELLRLPPFTTGQTVSEILDYLKIDFVDMQVLKQAGFTSFNDVIFSEEDFERFRMLYKIKKDDFLSLCKLERDNATKYFESIGLLDSDSIIFDCGWNGSSQYLLNNVLKKIGFKHNIKFLYAGLFDNEKSRKQLADCDFECCFFGIGENTLLSEQLKSAIVLFELFFGAPHNSVYRYADNANLFEFEQMEENFDCKNIILEGIKAYLEYSIPVFCHFFPSESAFDALSPLLRLMNAPTAKEACIIGDLENVDGFVAKQNEKKYLAKVSIQQIKKQKYKDFYWVKGLLKRPDISKAVKKYVAKHCYMPVVTHGQTVPNVLINPKYQKWILQNESKLSETDDLDYKPLISIVVPVYNVRSSELVACIESVLKQTYDNWELCMVDDASTWENVKIVLQNYEKHPKIHIAYHMENAHISKTTNDAIALAKGEYVAFLDCDDVLAPNAIYEMTRKLNEDKTLDFIYSDEDKITEDGKIRKDPFFKPDWSPDTFMSLMYTCHFAMYRKCIIDKIDGLKVGLEGAQDYDFTLRFTEKTNRIGHIAKILYHWRERPQSIASDPNAKPYALQSIKKLKEEALERRGLLGEVVFCDDIFQFRVKYTDKTQPLVSIIIPTKDNFSVFERCILSLKQKTSYSNYEIIVVDNGSSPKNKERYERAKDEYKFNYIYEPMDFNFSRMCNIGAKHSNGVVLLFLNNDTEIIQHDWLDLLVGHTSVPWSGAIGAKLLYPNSTVIQHIGVINANMGPSHAFIGFDDSVPRYYCINRLEYNFSAVTAACLAIRKDKFNVVGGFDESLPIAYNDVDFCFSLVENGFYNVVRNDVVLIHHESVSRGSDNVDEKKLLRLKNERSYLYEKHPNFFHSDPFYNHNLTQNRVDFDINV